MLHPTLKEAKRLYGLGFAILWLYPKSKRPVGMNWTKGPRKPWEELEASFREDYNVGVRTGTASPIGEQGYLACIDVDVKDKNYLDLAQKKIADLVPGGALPTVLSGSGSGSRHLYCVTKKPFKMITAVKIPEKLEIAIYSEGRQMALPPSVHPTGAHYVWSNNVKEASAIPVLDFSHIETVTVKADKKTKGSTAVNTRQEASESAAVDIWWDPRVPDTTRILITHGIWKNEKVSDRSAYLLVAADQLASHGLGENEILSVLTDRSTYLGACAYDHTGGGSRKTASEWVYKYTVKKVLEERASKIAMLETVGLDGTYDYKESEDEKFYFRGKNGARKPDYDGLLDAFKKEHSFKTVADMKSVFIFKCTHYEDVTPIEIKAFAERSFNPKPEEKYRAEFLCKVLSNNVIRRSFFNESTEDKVNFKNGVLDLNCRDAKLMPHSPEYGFRGVLPYDFDPKARCPVFEAWLRDVMLGDTALMAVLQEYMGYVVRGGEYKYHKALWLGGVGRNGKSTFIDLLKALIGAGNFSVISIKALMNDKFAGADLDGKIANFSEETSPQELADSGPFKNLTGDGDLFAQKKYGDPYNFRNRAKLIMTYNTIPDIKDLSPGMLSRPIIIPFEKLIGEEEQDQDIKKKLFKELSGIFNFALEGWKRLEENGGFTFSEKSEMAKKKLKEESCSVYQWVENHVKTFEDDSFEDDSLVREYRAVELHDIYSKRERYPYKFIEFCRRLNSHPKMVKRRKRDARGVYYDFIYVG